MLYKVVFFLDILSHLVTKGFLVTSYNVLVPSNLPGKFCVLSGYPKLHCHTLKATIPKSDGKQLEATLLFSYFVC